MSRPMRPDDPAYWMLHDGVETVPTVRNVNCYICRDPEFAQMGLPLCYECLVCKAHVPADDPVCDNGHFQPEDPFELLMILREHKLEVTPKIILDAVMCRSREYMDATKNYFEDWITKWKGGDDDQEDFPF